MAYNETLAKRVREYLSERRPFEVVEKKMFGGLAFMVNNKLCVNVSGNHLMCRFAPERTSELSKRPGFLPMVMNQKEYQGYCLVAPVGYHDPIHFQFWIDLCLDFNETAKSYKKNPKKR